MLSFFYPSSALQYLTESEIKLGSYTVPCDTFVFHNLWALLHDPKHYPVPHRFNPDRFLYNHQTFIEDERVRFVHFGRSKFDIFICIFAHLKSPFYVLDIGSV